MISQIMKPTPPIKSDQEGLSPSNDLHANDANNNPIEFKFKKLEFDIEELYSNQYSSFLHIPLPNAINRVDNGSLIIGELCKIFQVFLCKE